MSQERSELFRSVKTRLSLFLGLLMFTFGFLKFVNPTIDGWFHVQIQESHLPHSAILMGKIAEIMTGILFLLPRFRPWQAVVYGGGEASSQQPSRSGCSCAASHCRVPAAHRRESDSRRPPAG